MSSIQHLSGKVAIVTGAASGIGLEICKRFAVEGAKLVMVDSNESKLLTIKDKLHQKNNVEHHCIPGDVTSMSFAANVMNSTFCQFGEPGTILINSAGIFDKCNIMDMQEAKFEHVTNVNLNGTYNFAKAFLHPIKELLKSGKVTANIINISSMAGKMGMYQQSSYAASKSAVIGLTKSLCLEMGKYGVRCNAVLPSFTETPMIEPMLNASYFNEIISNHPMKRLGKPEEVASACLFLASDESSYVNGTCLEVNGGLGA